MNKQINLAVIGLGFRGDTVINRVILKIPNVTVANLKG